MVNAVSAVSGAQTSTQNTNVQSQASATPAPTPPPAISSIDFVVSGIVVNNLQNVAILEYRSSQTGDVINQYPDQAQINAFKAAQQLADQASQHQQAEAAAHAAAESDAVRWRALGGARARCCGPGVAGVATHSKRLAQSRSLSSRTG